MTQEFVYAMTFISGVRQFTVFVDRFVARFTVGAIKLPPVRADGRARTDARRHGAR